MQLLKINELLLTDCHLHSKGHFMLRYGTKNSEYGSRNNDSLKIWWTVIIKTKTYLNSILCPYL